jgi:hypothetical protein
MPCSTRHGAAAATFAEQSAATAKAALYFVAPDVDSAESIWMR